MRVMFVHGLGFHEGEEELRQWVPHWVGQIQHAARLAGIEFPVENPLGPESGPGGDAHPGVLRYEDVVREFPAPDGLDYLRVASDLLRSYLATRAGEWFRRERGLVLSDEMYFMARQVAAWAHDDHLRAALRKRVVETIRRHDPELVIAHSFGGLLAYDACLSEEPALMAERYFVTMGTQIGNAFLRREFGGRQIPVRARHWFNLHNPRDPLFVTPLDHIRAGHFTHLEGRHAYGHSGAGYLGHHTTAEHVWKPIRAGRTWTRRTSEIRARRAREARPPARRAVLVGIDRCRDAAIPPLAGGVNDTYLLSAALQEAGFQPREIRLLHNRRASRENVLDHLQWLLGDVRPGDHRFLAFSGHGCLVPSLNAEGEADQREEILVTYDYDFSNSGGVRDRDLQPFYADLPPESHFMMFLDCCHSGGVARPGGPAVRSVSGPPDIEHPCRRWNAGLQMWEQEGLGAALNPEFLPPEYVDRETREDAAAVRAAYYGRSGDVRRIGRATELRDLPYKKYDRLRERLGRLHKDCKTAKLGPYLPLVCAACRETQTASEYLHGSVSYGAFTFAMVQAIRDRPRGQRSRPTYGRLVAEAARKLAKLGYQQEPQLLANRAQRRTPVPFGQNP